MEFAKGVKPLLSGKIQNGRHKISKVIISSSIIEIETRLFHQTPYVFGLKECNKTNDTLIGHHYNAKFKMAATKSLK